LKILIDCRFWGVKDTGLGRYTKNLVVNLLGIDKSNDYILLVEKNHKSQITNYKQISNPKLKIQKIESVPYSFKEQVELPKIINQVNPDLIHFPHFNIPYFINKPFVVTIHDLIKHHSRGLRTTTRFPLTYFLKYWGYKKVFARAVRSAKKIIVPSEFVKKELLDFYKLDEKKIRVIYEGVGSVFQMGSRDAPSKMQTPYIVYTGNVYPHKNLRRLILAVKMINQSVVSEKPVALNLKIVGSRDVFLKRIKGLVKKLNAEKFVTSTGFLKDKKLAKVLKGAKAYVSASLMEGFGLPGLEAMSAGCPVICSDIPTFREVYGDAAVYFEAEEVDDIKEKILKVIEMSSSKKEKMIERGRKQAEKYSWEKCAKKTLGVYESLI